MTWYKHSCRNISAAGISVICLFAALGLRTPSATGQESLQDRYAKAVQFFNEAKMDDACEIFQQIEKESPGYKETHTYLNPSCTSAKQAYALEEALYNEGLGLFKQQRFDEAKQKFMQANRLALKHPKFRTQIENYLKQVETRSQEETLFQQAVQLYNDGKDDEAAKQFGEIEQSKGMRADNARGYLQRLKDRREDATWSRAVDLFAKNDFAEARPLFEELVRMNGKRASEAQDYLNRAAATAGDQRAFEEAVRLFNAKRYSDAGSRFQELVQSNSGHAAEARAYLQRIDNLRNQDAVAREQAKNKVAETGQDPKQVAQQFVVEAQSAMTNGQYVSALEKLKAAQILDPANRDARSMLSQAQELADEQPLRQGLENYFQGKYVEAEQELSAYVDGHGRKLALARFFLGAVHASRYFLSGEQDLHQKELAIADFRVLPKDAQQFQPPKDYVSPKILSLYMQVIGSRSQ
jgi:tetratricopeptide (TPR) repeat protein